MTGFTPEAASATAPFVTSTPAASSTALPSLTPLSIITATHTAAPGGEVTATRSATATDYVPPSATPVGTGETPPATAIPGTAGPTQAAPTHTPAPTATGTATARPLTIVSFTSSPAEIRPGEPVTLTWDVMADEATIYRLDNRGRLGEWYSVGLSGTLTLETAPSLRESVEFLLYATVGSELANARASTRIICPDPYFFPKPPATCPSGPAQSTLVQAQRFEHGLMLWTQTTDRIYVLYSDGGTQGWGVFQNAWFAGQPETDPDIVPPPGLFQPVRGFGLAWRVGFGPPSPAPRERLGWAIEDEFSVPGGFFQCEYQFYARCFISAPNSAVIVLEPEQSAWRIWTGP